MMRFILGAANGSVLRVLVSDSSIAASNLFGMGLSELRKLLAVCCTEPNSLVRQILASWVAQYCINHQFELHCTDPFGHICASITGAVAGPIPTAAQDVSLVDTASLLPLSNSVFVDFSRFYAISMLATKESQTAIASSPGTVYTQKQKCCRKRSYYDTIVHDSDKEDETEIGTGYSDSDDDTTVSYEADDEDERDDAQTRSSRRSGSRSKSPYSVPSVGNNYLTRMGSKRVATFESSPDFSSPSAQSHMSISTTTSPSYDFTESCVTMSDDEEDGESSDSARFDAEPGFAVASRFLQHKKDTFFDNMGKNLLYEFNKLAVTPH